MMIYKLNPEVKKILSPITVKFTAGESNMEFANGTALADAAFEKNYLIESLVAVGSSIVITLRENDKVNVANWVGEEAVSFF